MGALPIRQSNPWGSPEKHQQNQHIPQQQHQQQQQNHGNQNQGGGSFWLNHSSSRAPPTQAPTSMPSSNDRLYMNLDPINQPEIPARQTPPPAVSAQRAPHLSAQYRSHSLDNDFAPQPQTRAPTLREMSQTQRNWQSVSAAQVPVDPFDVAWAARAQTQAPAPPLASTNPFASGNTVKAFEVKL